MNLNQNFSTEANYIPNYGYPVYQQLVPHHQNREQRQIVNGTLNISERTRHEDLGDGFDLYFWQDVTQVPANGYLAMRLNGLGKKAISAGWSIAGYSPAYAIESFNDIIHNRSDQWIITIHNPTPNPRVLSYYLITKG
ncbi:hypothetical protein P8891_13405 [Bacillus atrophaeus]|uniref:hypothetical protein n=1 Tax=Bacillus atrophaeus TaxID=1452 RepID=UPI002281754B|nr:hypothetical protein [Bacillus atrophaeus]MCY7947327.1 hypothetical protein [Bacillus atrophaeus]MCY8094583.1 hypothetical protein [Bacillus atrophaeus]MCY8951460.1 hypothetical protein [Bacillus atrophaeus]MCY9168091.1 hypothetical protein [Bacillus atrophaeus]MEC0742031.1 hypothetical protein [Bacillus atrophaeus]